MMSVGTRNLQADFSGVSVEECSDSFIDVLMKTVPAHFFEERSACNERIRLVNLEE